MIARRLGRAVALMLVRLQAPGIVVTAYAKAGSILCLARAMYAARVVASLWLGADVR